MRGGRRAEHELRGRGLSMREKAEHPWEKAICMRES